MTSVLLIVHIIIAVGMVGIILIQKNEGGGLGTGSGTMGGLMTTRGTANLLTHITAIFAVLFFLSTLSLAIIFKGNNRSKSILDLPENKIEKSIPQPHPKSSQTSATQPGASLEKEISNKPLISSETPKKVNN